MREKIIYKRKYEVNLSSNKSSLKITYSVTEEVNGFLVFRDESMVENNYQKESKCEMLKYFGQYQRSDAIEHAVDCFRAEVVAHKLQSTEVKVS